MQARAGLSGAPVAAAPWRRYRSPIRPVPSLAPSSGWSFPLLLLFIVVLYACLPLQFPQLEKIAPAQSVAIAALAVLFLEKWVARQPVRLARPETYLLLAFVVLGGFSSFDALWPRYAFEQGLGLLKMVVVYLLVLNTVDSWKKLRVAMSVAVLGGLFPALGALHAYPAGGFAQGVRAGWLGIFANSNDLAYSLVLLMPLALALVSGARPLAKPLWLGAALVYTATILVTFSRGSLLALGVVLVLCLVRWGSASTRIIGACVLAGCLIFVTSFWTRNDTEGQLVDQATLDLRIATIKTGAAMLADHPILGVGLGCSLLGWPIYAPQEMASWNAWLGVHNTVVQVFTETGLLGGTVFLVMFAATLLGAHRASRTWKLRGRPDLHRMVSAQEISLYGFLVCGLTGGYVLSWFPYLFLGFASAARLLTEPQTPGVVSAPPSPSHHFGGADGGGRLKRRTSR